MEQHVHRCLSRGAFTSLSWWGGGGGGAIAIIHLFIYRGARLDNAAADPASRESGGATLALSLNYVM